MNEWQEAGADFEEGSAFRFLMRSEGAAEQEADDTGSISGIRSSGNLTCSTSSGFLAGKNTPRRCSRRSTDSWSTRKNERRV